MEVITNYISEGHFDLAKPMVPGKLPKSVLDFRCFEPPAPCLSGSLFLSDTRCSFVQPWQGSIFLNHSCGCRKCGLSLLQRFSTLRKLWLAQRGIKYNSAILVMQDRLIRTGASVPTQGFWFYAHAPWFRHAKNTQHPGMQYPRQVTNWEADQSLEHDQHSLLNQIRSDENIFCWEMTGLF